VKCHEQRENLGPFRAKTSLAYVLVRMIVEPLLPGIPTVPGLG
jgi:hypothetical protein